MTNHRFDRTLIVIPTYNERENVTALVPELFKGVPTRSTRAREGVRVFGQNRTLELRKFARICKIADLPFPL